MIGKYIDGTPDSEARAEEAFRRALELNPRLSVAHKFYANLEADIGQAQRALVRLLGEANRHGNDPELFAGLVHACRYCGLYEESIAAHAEARRLDPNVPTSLEQTLLMTGDIERLLGVERPAIVAGADDGIRVIGLGLAGRRDEARRALLDMRQASRIPAFQSWTDYLHGLARSPARGHARQPRPSQRAEDPGRPGGDLPGRMAALRCRRARTRARPPQRAVAKGYFVAPTLAGSPALRRAAEAIPLSRRSWRKRKQAASRRWLRSARPAESGFSAGDEAAVP